MAPLRVSGDATGIVTAPMYTVRRLAFARVTEPESVLLAAPAPTTLN